MFVSWWVRKNQGKNPCQKIYPNEHAQIPRAQPEKHLRLFFFGDFACPYFRFLAISHFLIEPVTSRLLNTQFLILYIGLAPLFPSHIFCCCSFWACWCLLQLMLKYVEMTLYSVFSVTWHSHSHKCRSSKWQQCATCFCGNLGDLSAGVNLLQDKRKRKLTSTCRKFQGNRFPNFIQCFPFFFPHYLGKLRQKACAKTPATQCEGARQWG